MSMAELMGGLQLKSKTGALKRAVNTLLLDGKIEHTLPDMPNSRLLKYRITSSGSLIGNSPQHVKSVDLRYSTL